MWGAIKSMLGTGEVISKGMQMIDDAFYTDSEKAEDKMRAEQVKTRNKIELMKAYAPFKVAQRYLALLFGITYIGTYIAVLVMFAFDKEVKEIMNILDMFSINIIMGIIITFYFGGGLTEGIMEKVKKR